MDKYRVLVSSRLHARGTINWVAGIEQTRGIMVISIHDPDKAPEFRLGEKLPKVVGVLTLPFWDELEDGYGCMNQSHAKDVAEFVMKHAKGANVIVVHCEAGISRSAGVGAALAYFMNGDDSYFFRGRFVPNRTCYSRVLRALLEFQQENLGMCEEEEREAVV